LPDATFERRHIGAYLRREHARDNAGLFGDELQVACRPRRRARGVDPGQPRNDSLELGLLRQAFSNGDSRIVADETDSMRRACPPAIDALSSSVDMPVRRNVLRRDVAFLDNVTRSRQSTPTGEE
jgi:hypothetical protein